MSAVLVIAGTDCGGGAGLARDLRTLTQLGSDALCAVTAVTAQSDSAVIAVHLIPPEVVQAQIAAALASGRVSAIKTGMLGTRAIVRAVVSSLPPRSQVPLVLDPVLAASSGGELLDGQGRAALLAELLPRATLLTPNIAEAAALLGRPEARNEAELLQQGEALLALGAAQVLLKGGHGSGPEATDLLVAREAPVRRFSVPRIAGARRGTGCALASAIAAALAAGCDVAEACARAKRHVTQLLQQQHD